MENATMNASALKEIFNRAENWPVEDQEELVKVARYIEQRQSSGFDLDAEDWKIIDARLEAARLGDIASDAEVASFFGKHRAA